MLPDSNAETSPPRQPALFRAKFDSEDFSEVARHTPVSDGRQVQLSRGRFRVQATLVRSTDALLLQAAVSVRTLAVTVPDPRFIAIVVPYRWTGEYRTHGVQATPSSFYLCAGRDGFYGVGGRREFMTLGLDRGRLVSTLAALQGLDPGELDLGDLTINLPASAMQHFREHLQGCLANALETTAADSLEETESTFENELFGAAVEVCLEGVPLLCTGVERRGPVPQTIVRRAEEYFAASGSQRVSLADLCAAAGVGRNTLQKAFRTLYGVSPLGYFHKRRLAAAREHLLRARPLRGTVKRIAVQNGLTEFGRFSVEYRRLFGETPSTTLRRRAAASAAT